VEAQVAGQAELAASSLDSQFEELELDSTQLEVEARLAELKQLGASGQQSGSLAEQPEETENPA